jgi:hypothetical protein
MTALYRHHGHGDARGCAGSNALADEDNVYTQEGYRPGGDFGPNDADPQGFTLKEINITSSAMAERLRLGETVSGHLVKV